MYTNGELQLTDIPLPRPGAGTKEALYVWRTLLLEIFDEYPSRDNQRKMFRCWAVDEGSRNSPQKLCWWACDTGAPNDKILSIYILLFC